MPTSTNERDKNVSTDVKKLRKFAVDLRAQARNVPFSLTRFADDVIRLIDEFEEFPDTTALEKELEDLRYLKAGGH